jgi:hypothetical protein
MGKTIILIISAILFNLEGVAVAGEPDLSYLNGGSVNDNECTILLISGQATDDGRPIIWKNRDVVTANQKYLFIPAHYDQYDTTYAFNGNFYADDSSRCFMGVNEHGFAVINANCYNLSDVLNDGMDDGDLMRLALQRCRNVDDWEALLRKTNLIGRKDPWLFGAMDAAGVVKLYECGNFNFVVYDANDPEDAPEGIIVRSVFALSGPHTEEGAERYKRAKFLVESRPDFYAIDAEYILQIIARDLYCSLGDPYPLPFMGQIDNLPGGWVNTNETINRFKSRSCSVIRGIKAGEDPRLTTTFAILGPPVLGVAVPLWVASGMVPDFFCEGDSAAWFQVICERMRSLYPVGHSPTWMNTRYLVDTDSSGVFSYTLGLESWAIGQADSLVESWIGLPLDTAAVRIAQDSIAETIWSGFAEQHNLVTYISYDDYSVSGFELPFCYPNPFNSSTTIRFGIAGLSDIEAVSIEIYNILGEKVRNLSEFNISGDYAGAIWDGRDKYNLPVSSGVYFYRLSTEKSFPAGSVLYLK